MTRKNTKVSAAATALTTSHTLRAYLKARDGIKSRHRSVIGRFDEFLGRPALVKDLNETTLKMFFAWMRDAISLTAESERKYQVELLWVANDAAALDLIERPMLRWSDRADINKPTKGASRCGLTRYFDDVYAIDRQQSDDPLTPSTLKSYRSAVSAFCRFAPKRLTVSTITSAKVKQFRQWLIDRGMNPKKAGNHAFAVAVVVKHAKPERFFELAEPLAPPADKERAIAWVFEHKYLPAKQSIASPKTVAKYLAAFNSFGRHLGHCATLDDLSDENVGSYMRACRAKGNAARTVNGYRCKLVSFWTWCAKRRMVEQFPTIEEMPEPATLPRARNREDVVKLLAGCARMPGTVAGIPACDWWRLLHLVCWDCCGERTGAMLAMRWDWLDWKTGFVSVPATFRKGGKKPMLYVLKAPTLRELRRIVEPERELMFPWDRDMTMFYFHYRRLLRLAGLPYVKYKSAIQMHRRTFATHLEMIGGNATEAFNHSDRSIAVDSYLDPQLIDRKPANAELYSLAEIK